MDNTNAPEPTDPAEPDATPTKASRKADALRHLTHPLTQLGALIGLHVTALLIIDHGAALLSFIP
jgi:hypothetical protein